jgi:hypothetical protein
MQNNNSRQQNTAQNNTANQGSFGGRNNNNMNYSNNRNLHGKNNFANNSQKKKLENLPRTGIEYPFMRNTIKFLNHCKEFEPLQER